MTAELLQADVMATFATVARIPAMLFPFLFLGFLAVSALVLLGRKLCQEVDQPIDPLAPGRRPALHQFMLAILLTAAFVYAAPIAGFVLVTAAMLFLLLWSCGTRWITRLALASTVPVALYHVFVHYFSVPLPRGWLGW